MVTIKSRRTALAAAIAALVILGVIGGYALWGGDSTGPSGTPPTVPATTGDGAVNMVGRAPLTGVPTDQKLDHPAVTVKVSNTPDAHPHRGLADADIVFVEPITGATTRLAAIFHSRLPDQVGPVRSLRPMDAPLIGPTKGVIADTMADVWVQQYVDQVADLANLGTLRVPSSGHWMRAEKWSAHRLEDGRQVSAQNVIVMQADRDTSLPQAKPSMTILDLVESAGTLRVFTGDKVVDGRARRPRGQVSLGPVQGGQADQW